MANNLKNNIINSMASLKPTHGPNNMMKSPECQPSTSAKPIHIRRLEQALDVGPFIKTFLTHEHSSDSDSSEDNYSEPIENLFKDEPHSAKDYYNFEHVSPSRKWLANVLSENIDTGPEDAPYKCLLKMHAYQKKLRKNKVNFEESMYYGAGLISAVDYYPTIEKEIPVSMSKTKTSPLKDETRSPLYDPDILDDISVDEPCLDLNLENGISEYPNLDGDLDDSNANDYAHSNIPAQLIPIPPPMNNFNHSSSKKKAKKFKDDEAKRKWEEMMTVKRRKMFISIAKKEIGKQHRAKSNKHKEMLLQCKRVASHCVKYARQKADNRVQINNERSMRELSRLGSTLPRIIIKFIFDILK